MAFKIVSIMTVMCFHPVVTCSDGGPVAGGAGAGAALTPDTDPVPLAAEQGADVTGGAAGGAGPVVHDVQGLRRGVVGEDADAGDPGDHGHVAATHQGGLHVGLGARPCSQRERVVTLYPAALTSSYKTSLLALIPINRSSKCTAVHFQRFLKFT